MMKNLKIYIIDSSVLIRQTLAGVVKSMENVVLQGSSSSGTSKEINSKIRDKRPDVILLGIDSKQSDETELFLNIRQTFPALPVIVVTPRSTIGAEVALFALKKGAVEYITKPEDSCHLLLARRHIEKRLKSMLSMIPRLNLDLLTKNSVNEQPTGTANNKVGLAIKQEKRDVELIIFSGCTGGVQSLFSLITDIPADLSVPVVIVQHMPKIFTRILAEELDKMTSLHVREATMNSLLVPGQVYLIPGGYHASIKNNGSRKIISLHRGPKEHKCRPSIDVLLRSVRNVYDDRVLAVFLSGGGMDGLLGAITIAETGGQIILQDKKSSLIWDLPARILEHGISAETYGIEEIGKEIRRRINIDLQEKSVKQRKRYRSIHQNNKSNLSSRSI